MRNLVIAAAVFSGLFDAAPAIADTLTEVTTHGIVLTLGDTNIEVTYTPDGQLSALDGQVTGTWRIDGDKLCTSSSTDPNESCYAYPKDKKSGDAFILETPGGPVQIKIR